MQSGNLQATPAAIMTTDSIADYISYEQNRGVTVNALRRCRRFTASLYDWLPEDKTITKEMLLAWRENLKGLGYSAQTELNYVKGINRYLDYIGRSDLRFNRGKAKDIAGKQFGYLTAIEPTGEKNRKDLVWRCICKCGTEVEYPATRLLTGNTLSCGCLKGEHFKQVNKYIDGTSLRQSIDEKVFSTRAESGYTGVTRKRDKWRAYIKYKGQNISLGCYSDLKDAVKARARGKELVRMDALGLLDFYEELHKDDPERPTRDAVRKQRKQPNIETVMKDKPRVVRSNNTSGYSGVSKKRDKWAVKITYKKVTYQLGTFETIEEAVAVRKNAEQLLSTDPQQFREKYRKQKENGL